MGGHKAMAQAILIERGNTVVHILKAKKGLQEHESHRWLPIMRR
jgi:phage portal protein BeeE